MTKTLLEEFVSTEAGMRRFQQERAISAVTGLISQAMDEKELTRAKLAAKLGTTKGWVTQLLDGDANKTIRTVADVLAVMGQELRIACQPIQIGPHKPVLLKIWGGKWSGTENRSPIPLPLPLHALKVV
jgi:transcriptional regulator with XRE-family HTH domain